MALPRMPWSMGCPTDGLVVNIVSEDKMLLCAWDARTGVCVSVRRIRPADPSAPCRRGSGRIRRSWCLRSHRITCCSSWCRHDLDDTRVDGDLSDLFYQRDAVVAVDDPVAGADLNDDDRRERLEPPSRIPQPLPSDWPARRSVAGSRQKVAIPARALSRCRAENAISATTWIPRLSQVPWSARGCSSSKRRM